MTRLPPSFCTRILTTSMPTPRPEISVVRVAVEKPGMVTSISASSSDRRAAASRDRKRRSAATRRRACGSIPLPSSETTRLMRSSCRDSSISIRPRGGLPAVRRASVSSRPWSMLLRRICCSGSIISSSVERSRVTSVPRTSRSTDFPSRAARSRALRSRRGTIDEKGRSRMVSTSSRSPSTVRPRPSRISSCSEPASGSTARFRRS